MQLRIRLSNLVRQGLQVRLNEALASGARQLAKRICALLFLDKDLTVAQVAEALEMGEQTVRDTVGAYLLQGLASLRSRRRPGRPPKLTKTQRKELARLIDAGPEASGYPSACWSSVVIADLIQSRFGVSYHPQYVCQLLDTLGFSYQKGRFVSDHLSEAARQEWDHKLWPQILRLAEQKHARILFGDEASFAQWGSLSYTWARKGQQPTVKTSGRRRGYKVFGLIDLLCGSLFSKAQEGRFNSESYAAFLSEVLAATSGHIILVHDRVAYHTSAAMKAFYAEHADRLSVFELPAYSPDFNPIEFLWKKVKTRATHLKYFPEFEQLMQKVDEALLHFAQTPSEITSLVGHYCESLGKLAA